MSPGTATGWPESGAPGVSVIPSGPTVRRAPNPPSMRSVWSREGVGSRTVTGPSAQSPARSSAVLTWAEATGEA